MDLFLPPSKDMIVRRSKRSWGRFQPVMKRQGRPFVYRGWKIEILNNRAYSFRFEYVITAPKQRPRKIPAIIGDPTSHRTFATAKYFAKVNVNEMRNPFWLFNIDLDYP